MKKALAALTVFAKVLGVPAPADAHDFQLVAGQNQPNNDQRASSHRAQQQALEELTTTDIIHGIRDLLKTCDQLGFTCIAENDELAIASRLMQRFTPQFMDFANKDFEKTHHLLTPSKTFTPLTAAQLALEIATSKQSNYFISGPTPDSNILVSRAASPERLAELDAADPTDMRAKIKALRTFEVVAHELGHGLTSTQKAPASYRDANHLMLYIRQKENAADGIMYAAVSSQFGAAVAHYSLSQWATDRARSGLYDPNHTMSANLRQPFGKIVDHVSGQGLSPENMKSMASAVDGVLRENFLETPPASPFQDGPFKEGYDIGKSLPPTTLHLLFNDRAALAAYAQSFNLNPEQTRGLERAVQDFGTSLNLFRDVEPQLSEPPPPTLAPHGRDDGR